MTALETRAWIGLIYGITRIAFFVIFIFLVFINIKKKINIRKKRNQLKAMKMTEQKNDEIKNQMMTFIQSQNQENLTKQQMEEQLQQFMNQMNLDEKTNQQMMENMNQTINARYEAMNQAMNVGKEAMNQAINVANSANNFNDFGSNNFGQF